MVKFSTLFLLSSLTWGLVEATPNFIIMQPDDYRFFEEWNPPGHVPNRAQIDRFPADLPWVEKLRTQGLTLKRAYTASPMCGTSRYSTITGRYPSRSAYGRNSYGQDALANVVIPTTKLADIEGLGNDCSENNLAALLSQNGYRTGMVGKWHLSRFTQQTYTYNALRETVQGCGFTFAEGLYAENLNSNIYEDGDFSHNMEWVTAQGANFISDAVAAEDPFFLYFNPTVPHGSANVLDALTVYKCRQTPEGLLGEEPSVPFMTAHGVGCDAYRQTVLDRANGVTDNHLLGSIWVDDAIGALMQHLEALGQLDNTFFLFQMDHGQEAKGSLYEPGIHMASFVHFPDAFKAGSTFDGITSTIDIGPTVLDFAGIDETAAGYYAMDGDSWRNAVGTDLETAWKERCIVTELSTDRAVVCGCDKYLTTSTDSPTSTKGGRLGLAVGDELQFRLCNEEGSYITSPDGSPETVVASEPDALTQMKSIHACHLDVTNPGEDPDFDTTCFALPKNACNDPEDFLGSRLCFWVSFRKKERCSDYASNCPKTCESIC